MRGASEVALARLDSLVRARLGEEYDETDVAEVEGPEELAALEV